MRLLSFRSIRLAALGVCFLAFVVALSVATTPVGYAAPLRTVTLQVTTTADTSSSDGACSLREAIAATNTNATVNECAHDGSTGADTITFAIPSTDSGCSAPDVCTITLGSTLPAIDDALTIDASAQDITVSGDDSVRVMDVNSGKTLELVSVKIIDGYAAGYGAILNDGGTLTISNSQFRSNSAFSTAVIGNIGGTVNIENSLFSDNQSSLGSAITNVLNGTLNIDNSVFENNHTGVGTSTLSSGGAIGNQGTVNLSNSTFSANSADIGGAVQSTTGTMIITNSTFFANGASNNGGAISNNGVLYIINSTLAGDTANQTFRNSGTATLKNTIVSNAGTGTACSNTLTLTADSYNLASDASCDNATQKTVPEIGLAASPADNGGSTPTLAIGANSAALDAGDDTVCAAAVGAPNYGAGGLDQRGITRPQDTQCDVGAFERKSDDVQFTPTHTPTETSTPTPTHTPTETGTPTNTPTNTLTFTPTPTNTPLPPATIQVTTTQDTVSTDGGCSLREALTAANTNTTVNECMRFGNNGAETIVFAIPASDGGCSASNVCTITLGSTLPAIDGDVTIDGSAQDITISGNNATIVLQVNAGKTLNAHYLTITDGTGGIHNNGTLNLSNSTLSDNTSSLGGGISNNGSLSVDNSHFTNNLVNVAAGWGGAIYNSGMATITNSTFSDNHVTAPDNAYGGGLANDTGGTMTIANSTISNNSATSAGGGIINNTGGMMTVTDSTLSGNNVTPGAGGGITNWGTLNVTDSTFSGNISNGGGGGIFSTQTLNVTNSTFSGNSATNGAGGGILNYGATTLRNTIVANSPLGMDCYNTSYLAANNFNLDSDGSCGNATTITKAQIELAASLADNGGSTQTLAIGSKSAALDAGDDTICAATMGAPNFGAGGLDQRGITRPQGTHCDIGAFERKSDDVQFTPTPTNTPTITPTATRTFTPSRTNTPTNTPTRTRTFTRTFTPIITRTATWTLTPTQTRTFTRTFTPTHTRTATWTLTPTHTRTASTTYTPSATPPDVCDINKPAKPLLKAPINNFTTPKLRPVLKWKTTQCAETYTVTIKNALTGAKIQVQKGLDKNKLKFKPKALTPGTTYKWSVKACNSSGCANSKKWQFTVVPQ